MGMDTSGSLFPLSSFVSMPHLGGSPQKWVSQRAEQGAEWIQRTDFLRHRDRYVLCARCMWSTGRKFSFQEGYGHIHLIFLKLFWDKHYSDVMQEEDTKVDMFTDASPIPAHQPDFPFPLSLFLVKRRGSFWLEEKLSSSKQWLNEWGVDEWSGKEHKATARNGRFSAILRVKAP